MSFHLAKTILHKNLLHSLAYPGMIIVYVFEAFFVPLVMALVWITILSFESNTPSDHADVATYYLLLPVISILVSAWHGPFWSRMIRLGDLNMRLIKPLHPIVLDIGNNLAEKIIKICFLGPMLAVGFWLLKPELSLELWLLPVLLLSILGAAILSYIFESLIGLAGFWMEDTSSLSNFGNIAEYTLGGRVVPIFLFPLALRQVVDILPFRYMLAFPLEIVTGSLTNEQIGQGLFTQIIWIGIMVFVFWAMWRGGFKRYSASGG